MSHENWYNILTDRLPDSVEVNGKTYPVHTSFRDWISFFFLHEDADLTDIEKVTLAMNWCLRGNRDKLHIVRYVLLLLLLSAECKRGQVAVQLDVWSP